MSECTTCSYYGKHIDGPSEAMPWPCVECACGEKYVERGKRKHQVPLRVQNDQLRARLAEVEAQRDGLKAALQKIADGRGMIPDKSTIFMNGKVPEVPKVFNHYDMRDIARESLAKLEAQDGK